MNGPFVLAAGGTGEFFSLTPAEYVDVVRTAVEACRGGHRVEAGAGEAGGAQPLVELTGDPAAGGGDQAARGVLGVLPDLHQVLQVHDAVVQGAQQLVVAPGPGGSTLGSLSVAGLDLRAGASSNFRISSSGRDRILAAGTINFGGSLNIANGKLIASSAAFSFGSGAITLGGGATQLRS